MTYGSKLRHEVVEVMANLIDGFLFRLDERTALRVKGVFLEEEAHLVAGGEEVLVADVLGVSGVAISVCACREARHGVGFEREVMEEGVSSGEERCALCGAEIGGDDQVAVAGEGGELFRREAKYWGLGVGV